MSDAARKCNGPSPEFQRERDVFERIYYNGHVARAGRIDPDAPQDNESLDAREEKYEAAALALPPGRLGGRFVWGRGETGIVRGLSVSVSPRTLSSDNVRLHAATVCA